MRSDDQFDGDDEGMQQGGPSEPHAPRGEPDSGASRRSFRATLRAAAARVDGVDKVGLKLGRRDVRVRVTTHRTRPDGIADSVRAAVAARIDRVDPARRPAVKVRLRTSRSTS